MIQPPLPNMPPDMGVPATVVTPEPPVNDGVAIHPDQLTIEEAIFDFDDDCIGELLDIWAELDLEAIRDGARILVAT